MGLSGYSDQNRTCTRASWAHPDDKPNFKVGRLFGVIGIIFSPMLPKIDGSPKMNLPVALCLVAAVVLVATALLSN
jgi:hypothetical protein